MTRHQESPLSDNKSRVFIDDVNGWQESFCEDSKIHFKGADSYLSCLKEICALEISSSEKFVQNACKIIDNNHDYGGACIVGGNHALLIADHVRSVALYYRVQDGKISVSPDSWALCRDDFTPDESSIAEFICSGYVSGKHTLHQDVKCLQPGEIVFWQQGMSEPLCQRHYRYIPTNDSAASFEDNKEQLGEIIDSITDKMIARADGRPIWIPLSAGLDSRIILCKLHEKKYPDIQTFTYGPRFNFEAYYAGKMAKHLGVPWRMVGLSRKRLRGYFDSARRKEFWRYASGLKGLPCMREFSAILSLRDDGIMPENAVVINGQSGDYITGGHVAAQWFDSKEFNRDDYYKNIVDKHYDLWKPFKTRENIELIKPRIDELSPGVKDKMSGYEWAVTEEAWEYDARQICYVVTGQRIYDYCGLDWELPLWEKSLVEFYRTIPLDQKKDQKLYKEYLRDYNYKGLFPEKDPYIWRWPVPMLWVVPVARIIGLVAGKKAKDRFYARMRYYGHYANQYAYFDWDEHKKSCEYARNNISPYVPHWLMEHKNSIGEDRANAYLHQIGYR